MKKILLIVILTLGIGISAQIPNNDECYGAVPLTVNPDTSCSSKTAGTTIAATKSSPTTCAGSNDDDVWFSFTATGTKHIVTISDIVPTTIGSNEQMYFEILTGTCGTLINKTCSFSGANVITGLTPGQSYYIRVYTESSAIRATFNICIGTPVTNPPPVNNECSTATPLTVSPDTNCTTVTTGNTLGATMSMPVSSGCNGAPDDDVWFSFVATANSHIIKISDIVSTGALPSISTTVTQIFSGSCNALTSMGCTTSNVNVIGGLTPGQTYYIRVYTWDSEWYNVSFKICVTTPAPTSAPTNDECAAAIPLTVNANTNCNAITAGNTLGATQSATPSCAGETDDDIWYSFVATQNTHTVTLSNIVSTGTLNTNQLYTQVFSGTCAALTSLKCSFSNTTNISGLIAGQTYYLRIYTSQGNGYNASFNICVGVPAILLPTNDECYGAVPLTVNPDTSCNSKTAGTTIAATKSSPTTCAGSNDDDVWFSFTATGTKHIVTISDIVPTTIGSNEQMYFEILTGTCGTLINKICSFSGANVITGLTPGQSYYIRVYTESSAIRATFNICIGTPVTNPPPVNNECSTATPLTVNPDTNCTTVTTGNTLGATMSMPVSSGCNGAPDDDVWFSFVATANSHIIKISDIVSTGALPSISTTVTQIFSGSCNALTSMGCTTSNVNVIGGLTPGQTYYIRVYTWDSEWYNVSFKICVTTPAPTSAPTNDECAAAIPLTVNANTNCNAITAGNTLGATQSATPSCAGETDDDIWYSFVATQNTHTVTLSNIVSTGTLNTNQLYTQVFSGTCAALTSLKCSFSNTTNISGLIAGQTYYLRIYTSQGNGYNASFNICVSETATLGTSDILDNKVKVTVYPNPFNSILNVSNSHNIKNILISDMTGRHIKTIHKPEPKIDLNILNSGAYIITLEMKDGLKQTVKVIKK